MVTITLDIRNCGWKGKIIMVVKNGGFIAQDKFW
jgi:hypothetical protein